MGKSDKSPSIYEAALGQSTRKLLETCTADGEDKPAESTLRELFDTMRAASPEECSAIGEWFDQRLGNSSVDIKVKAILLMNDAVKLGHKDLHAALLASCADTLQALKTFKCDPHPQHGELPAKMVRNRSGRLITTLKEPPPAAAGGGGLGAAGWLLGFLCVVLALVVALQHNQGSPALLWYRTQRSADRLLQSASDTLFGVPPPPEHNDTIEPNRRHDPLTDPFLPGEEPPASPDAPPPPTEESKGLSSEDTFASIQKAFKYFDDGDTQGGVTALDENHQSVLKAHLAGTHSTQQPLCSLCVPYVLQFASNRTKSSTENCLCVCVCG